MTGIPITFDDRLLYWENFRQDENGSLWAAQGENFLPGSACWCGSDESPRSHLRYVCPCGCGAIGTIPIVGYPNPQGWAWDGNKGQPTLTPSILRTAGCRWHGYLRKGVWERC
jgi:hypothetical protein